MRSEGGYSTIEALVVAATLGTLVSVAAPQFEKYIDRTHDAVVQYDLRNAATAATLHELAEGEPPGRWEDILAAGHQPSGPLEHATITWDPDQFCVSLTHPDAPDRPFRYLRDEGHVTAGDCSSVGPTRR